MGRLNGLFRLLLSICVINLCLGSLDLVLPLWVRNVLRGSPSHQGKGVPYYDHATNETVSCGRCCADGTGLFGGHVGLCVKWPVVL